MKYSYFLQIEVCHQLISFICFIEVKKILIFKRISSTQPIYVFYKSTNYFSQVKLYGFNFVIKYFTHVKVYGYNLVILLVFIQVKIDVFNL